MFRAMTTGFFLLFVSCAGPVLNHEPAVGTDTLFAVSVIWGDEDSRSVRSLADDPGVDSVTILVEDNAGSSIGTGSLSKVGAVWKGTISVSATGSATFRAIARSSTGKLLYGGLQGQTLNGSGDSVSIAVQTLSLQGGGVQGLPLSLLGKVSTFAGAKSQFRYPTAVTGDGTNLYVADTNNHIIRKIVLSTGAVSTLAGLAGVSGFADGEGSVARFYMPKGIALAGDNLYVADSSNRRIRKIEISSGTVSTFAGTDAGSLDGTGTSAQFWSPAGLAVVGNVLYVTDESNHNVRAVDLSTQEVTTVAGSTSSGDADETGTAATFNSPWGVTSDGTNLYIADRYNNKVRKIVIATKLVTTLAGSEAAFDSPCAVATDGTYVYVADAHNQKIRKVAIADGAVSTFAGNYSGDYDGTGTSAGFYYPRGIARIGTDFYVTDTSNHRIRKITSAAVVTTVAGSREGSLDGPGLPEFNLLEQITTDGIDLFVADSAAHVIRRINLATGTSSVFAGTEKVSGSSNGTGAGAQFYNPQGITTDGTHLYVADTYNHRIRKIEITSGVVTTLAGSSWGYFNAQGASALFKYPNALTTDGTNVYVADEQNNAIRKIVIATGEVTTVAGQGVGTNSTGTADTIKSPRGVTTDGTNLYVTGANTRAIRKIALSTGDVTLLAGVENDYGTTDGTGSAARFNEPQGIVCDGANLFVADYWNHNVRKIDLASGTVTTVAGPTNQSHGEVDGTGTTARFYRPVGITTDGTSLYVTDADNQTIRKIH